MSDAKADARIDAVLSEDGLSGSSDAALARLLESAAREYGARWQDGRAAAAFPAGTDISATDVMVVTTAMLKAVNLQPFELGMWQAWTGDN
jgi:hypothetical protein